LSRYAAVLLLLGGGNGDQDGSVGAVKPFKDIAGGLASNGMVALVLRKPMPKVMFKSFVTKSVTLEECVPHSLLALGVS
jgi:hypothetical protein